MKALAHAVIHALAFLELSDDETIDHDSAVDAMEMLTSDLQQCSEEEREALKEAVAAEYQSQQARHAPQNVLDFYKDFLQDIGWEGEE